MCADHVVVDRRKGVVEAHEADAIVARWTPRRSKTRRGPRSQRPPDADALEELRVRYLGRKSELKLALREVRDRETGMALNAARAAIEEALAGRETELAAAAAEDGEPFDPTLPGEPFRARQPAPDHAAAPPDRGRLPRDGLRGLRRPRGRDRLAQLRRAQPAGGAPLARSARHLLSRRRDAAAHPHLALADPGDAGAGAAGLPRLARAGRTGATRSTRRTRPSSTRSRGSPSTAGSRSPTSAARSSSSSGAIFGQREVRMRTSFFPFTEPSVEFDITCYLCDGRRLPRLQALGLDRDGRRGRRRPERLRGRRLRPRGVVGLRLRARDSTGSPSSATASPTCASSGRTTCG